MQQRSTSEHARAYKPETILLMNMYKPVPKVPDFPTMEREMLRFWEEHRIFDKLRACSGRSKEIARLDFHVEPPLCLPIFLD